jgi:diacylglycerol kinase (ATP)
MKLGVVVNPTSGKGRGARAGDVVAARLRSGGAEVVEIRGSDAADAEARCRAAVAAGLDGLVAVGGDGMVHLAEQAVVETATPLGIIAAGTGNDLAGALGLPTDPWAAAEVVLAGRTRVIDAVRADVSGEVRWFGCVLGAGFDSAVNERANAMRWPRGQQRYNLAILAELRTFHALPFRLVLDGEAWETKAMLVAVANGTSYGGGMKVAPDALLDDGLLDVMVLGPVSKLEFLKTFPKVFKGTHVSHPAVTVRRAREVSLDAPGVTAYADGERFAPLPVTLRCVPGALAVFVPTV